MRIESKLSAAIALFLSALTAGQPTTEPAVGRKDLDLSTPAAAALTHWKTRNSSDPAIIRAQYFASNPAEAHALDVWIEHLASYERFTHVALEKFGAAAREGPDSILPVDPKEELFSSLKWDVDGNVAIPVNPPEEIDEEKMVLVDHRWVQPIANYLSTNEERLQEITKQSRDEQALTADLESGKFKELKALHAAWEKNTPAAEPPLRLLLPAYLPNRNPTTPRGALAGFALAVVQRDSKDVSEALVSTGAEEKKFTAAMLDWINADMELTAAIENRFGQAASEKFWADSGMSTPTFIAYVLVQKIGQSQIEMSLDGQKATIGVPGGLAWDMRKSGDRWKLSLRDSAAELSQIDGGTGKPKTVPDSFEIGVAKIAQAEREVAHDVATKKLTMIDDLKETLHNKAEAAVAGPSTQGVGNELRPGK